MAVTFRETVSVERGSVGADGRLESFASVARRVPATFWFMLEKRVAIEGEVFEADAQALLRPGTDVRRRDVVVARSRRWEVLGVFQGHNLSNVHRFVHVVLREAV